MATINDINRYKSITVNPLLSPDQLFELYSVPSFDNQYPEVVTGKEIGSTKVAVQENDVLICKINPRINRVWVVKHNTQYPLIASSEWIVVRSPENDSNYLKWYFSSPQFKNLMVSQVTGIGGSLTRAQPKQVATYPVPLPDFPTQRRIANTLDKVAEGIALCRKTMDELDLMVKAKFQEMFGDVFDNSKNFGTCLFGDYASQMNIGPFGSDLKNDSFVSKENGYCMVYEQKHAIDKNMLVEARYVTEEKYQQMKRFDIGPGDIIVSCRGTIGKCFILPDGAPHGIIHPSLMMIKPKNTVNHTFLLFLLESILKEQQEQGTGVKMAIKASELAKIKCIAPPRELQDSYVTFVSQINKSKLTIQGIRDKMEMEKLALMQEYFGRGV